MIISLEKRISQFENSIPDWLPVGNYFASQYNYTPDGLRKWCITNIKPEHYKKFGKTYHIHKNALHLLKKNKI